jgi:hypothetical protein
MRISRRKRWMLLGGVTGATLSAIVVGSLGAFAGSGLAAAQAKPEATSPPTITGTPQEGQVLTGHNGTWNNNPTDFNFFWMRCDKDGGSCARIAGETARTYTLKGVDVGNTIRFQVQATNSDGSTLATSVPTGVVTKATAPPPPPPSRGCPAGSGPVNVNDVTSPARLILDGQQSNPAVVTSSTTDIVLRYHVSNTCGQTVQGALVYTTAVPFNQWSIPAEQPTGPDGWAEVRLHRLKGFPVSPHQQLIALFSRARKSGEPLLTGISTRRLFSLRVNLSAG